MAVKLERRKRREAKDTCVYCGKAVEGSDAVISARGVGISYYHATCWKNIK
jgi:hypothetical protein